MTSSNNPALTGAIAPTFFYYVAASMLGLIAITTTSLVDGAFVGNYAGADALASVSLLLPVFTVLFAVALAFAIGGSVAAGTHMGEGNQAGASTVFSQTLLATLAFATSFALASAGFEQSLYALLGVPTHLLPLVTEYFGVIRWVLVLQLTTMVLYYFVRADGHPVLATAALVVGATSNIALDALFVVIWGWGLKGAAYATALSQLIQAGVLCTYFLSPSRSLRFSLVQRRWSRLFKAAYNGLAEFVNETSAGIVFWLLNHLLLGRLGVEGIAAYGVVNYYVYLSLMLSYGIADALHLLVSQNYGAGQYERVARFLFTALACSLTLGVTLSLVVVVFRSSVTGWFLGTSDAAIALRAAQVVLVVWPLFLVNVTNVIISCYLTAVHRPGPSALIAVMRGLVLPVSLLMVASVLVEQGALFSERTEHSFLTALPLAEWLTFGLALVLCYRYRPTTLGPRTSTPESAYAPLSA